MPAYVYIMRCRDASLYTGWTNNLEKRLEAHNSGKGAKYTRGRGPVTLVYSETLATREEALHRECEIKKMTKTAKLALIEQNINEYKQKY